MITGQIFFDLPALASFLQLAGAFFVDENAEKKVKIFSRHENMAWRVVAIIITVRGRINTECDRLP
mgnify:CR=1 FL=1